MFKSYSESVSMSGENRCFLGQSAPIPAGCPNPPASAGKPPAIRRLWKPLSYPTLNVMDADFPFTTPAPIRRWLRLRARSSRRPPRPLLLDGLLPGGAFNAAAQGGPDPTPPSPRRHPSPPCTPRRLGPTAPASRIIRYDRSPASSANSSLGRAITGWAALRRTAAGSRSASVTRAAHIPASTAPGSTAATCAPWSTSTWAKAATTRPRWTGKPGRRCGPPRATGSRSCCCAPTSAAARRRAPRTSPWSAQGGPPTFYSTSGTEGEPAWRTMARGWPIPPTN